MKAVQHPGECKLCGKFKELTFEHVPPKKAFNASAVKVLPFEEVLKLYTCADGRKPWDVSGLKGKIQQKGGGGYYLCRECNNNTGSWYIEEYVSFIRTIREMMACENFEVGNAYSFKIMGLHPLRILKAVMTMFCDINNECFGDESLRKFLLQKDNQDFNTDKYAVYMYLVSPQMSRVYGLMAESNVYTREIILSSEIAVFPVGFALCIDKPKGFIPFGVCISDFCKSSFDHQCDISFENVPFVDLNTQFPLDYRTKEQLFGATKEHSEESGTAI